MASSRFPIPQGTLDMLILQTLSTESAHGYAIARRLQQISRDVVQVNQGYSPVRAISNSRSRRPAGISWRSPYALIFNEGA